jgi:C4-dicarboxylate transporter, DctQ subunit
LRPALKRLAHAHDAVTDIGGRAGMLCLVLIVFAYCYEVVARYFFGAPTWWANEVVSYALSIGAFLMLPLVTRTGGHVAVTLIVDLLPAAKAAWLGRAIHLCSFATCAAAAAISLEENVRQVVQDVHLMKVHPIPQIYISAWMTYGFASSALYFLRMALAPPAAPPAAMAEIRQ